MAEVAKSIETTDDSLCQPSTSAINTSVCLSQEDSLSSCQPSTSAINTSVCLSQEDSLSTGQPSTSAINSNVCLSQEDSLSSCQPSTSAINTSVCLSQEDSLSSTITTNSDYITDPGNEAELWEDMPTEDMEFEKADDEYFFETDHPALKANSDYKKLLKTVLLLETKRANAIQDLEKLYECRDAALNDPIAFVDKLQRREDLGLPRPQEIPEIPEIDWTKYAVTSNETAFERRQLTRQSTKIMSNILSPVATDFEEKKVNLSDAKSNKASQPWSAEEQKKLEELLVQYPPEETEVRRWEKIANELENRTPVQVASRVQKYFIKLMRAGMPIPGRQPNPCYNRKLRRTVLRQKPSTFFVSYGSPLFMNDDDDSMGYYGDSQGMSYKESSSDSSDDSDQEITEDLKNTDEYKEYLNLKKAIKEKKQLSAVAQHVGYKCERCQCEPILGVRWHCKECSSSVDFCEDCVDCNHETDTHTMDHELEAIKDAVICSLDWNYQSNPIRNYNYLDPNYRVEHSEV